jgi:VanZ family protein
MELAWKVPSHRLSRWILKDILVNVALYVPLGASAYLALRSRRTGGVAAAAAIAAGAALSLTVEFIQRWEPGRVPSVRDVLTNTAGTCIGTLVAAAGAKYLAFQHVRKRSADGAATWLLGVMGAWLLVPFFPVRGRTAIYTKIGIFRTAPFDWVDFASTAAIWLAAGHLLQAVIPRRAVPVLAAATLLVPAQLVIATRQPTLSELAGALAGCLLLASGVRQLTAAFLLLAVILAAGLMPLPYADASHPLSWVPFGSFLRQDWQVAILSITERVLYYGTTIWLLNHAGVSGLIATVAVAGILAALEAAQTLVPGHTPEITDPLLALLLGLVLVIRQGNRPVPPNVRGDKLVRRM